MSKVVIVTNIPSPYRVDLFYYMQTHITEHEFHVIYTSRSEDNRQWNIDDEKLLNSHILEAKVIKIKKEMDNRYIHLPANIGKTLSEIKPDVVIAFEYNPAALQSLLWCRLHGAKFIHLTDGTLNSERNIGKVQKLSRKLIINSADACIASSTKAKEKLLSYGVSEEKIFLSLLTVDQELYKNLERIDVPGRLLYVGSMIKRKGLDLLIDALQYVESDWNLHIVGNGSAEEKVELEELAKNEGIDSKIQWCGYREGSELLKEYQEAQMFVLPTREDCYGLVLLEALYARVPIVSSIYADGAYDIVHENGVLADPFDAKAFGKAIDMVLNDKTYYDSALNEDMTRFAFSEVTKVYVAAVNCAVANHGTKKGE